MSLNKSSKELLVDLVNKDHKKSYGVAEVEFENLLEMPYDAERNTGITIKSAVGTTPLAEPKNLYYDRVVLGELAVKKIGAGVVTEIEDVGYASVHDLLPDINALLGTALAAEDLIDTVIDDSTYPRDVVVKADPNSLVYKGEFTLVLVNEFADVTVDFTYTGSTEVIDPANPTLDFAPVVSGSAASYLWEFDVTNVASGAGSDPTTSTTADPTTHQYAMEIGSVDVTVRLSVTDSNGLVTSASKIITLTKTAV